MITIENAPNVHCRVYHVRESMTDHQIETRYKNGPNPSDTSPCMQILTAELFAVPGIEFISLKPYQLQVHKAPVFSWYEIEPAVLALLQRLLGVVS